MGTFLSWLTGTASAGKMIDIAKETGDSLIFTEEEKSKANQEILDWSLDYLRITSPQNVARRLIAAAIVLLWVLMVLAAAISGYFDRSDGSYSVWLFEVLEDIVAVPFLLITGFYFATSLSRSIVSRGRK